MTYVSGEQDHLLGFPLTLLLAGDSAVLNRFHLQNH